MKKLLIFFIWCASSQVSAQINFFGEWKIVSFKGGDIAEINDVEASKYVGRSIYLETNRAIIFGDTCQSVLYKVRRANANEFLFYNYRTYAKTLEIKADDVDVLELYCNNKLKRIPDFDLIIVDENFILISLHGYFFRVKKNN